MCSNIPNEPMDGREPHQLLLHSILYSGSIKVEHKTEVRADEYSGLLRLLQHIVLGRSYCLVVTELE